MHHFISPRAPAPKRKRAGTIRVDSPIKTPDSPDFNFGPRKVPLSSTPVEQYLLNPNPKGDVSTAELDDRIKAFYESNAGSTALMLLADRGAPAATRLGVTPEQSCAMLLALINGETTFRPRPDDTGTTSSWGWVQFTRATYAAAIRRAMRIAAQLGDRWARMLRLVQRPARAKHDTVQYGMAMVAQMDLIYDRVSSEWLYQGRWLPMPQITGRLPTREFQSIARTYLGDRLAGLQALVTAYHMNGLNKFHKESSLSSASATRIPQDVGFLRAVLEKRLTTGIGDISSAASEIDPGDINPRDLVRYHNLILGQRYGITSGIEANGTATTIGHKGEFNVYRTAKKRRHKGLDLRARPSGQPVFAVDAGTILTVSPPRGSGWGTYIVLAATDGARFRYAHLSRTLVKPGEQVLPGQLIALSGDSEAKGRPHVHFEYYPHSKSDDPKGGAEDPRSDPAQRWMYAVNFHP